MSNNMQSLLNVNASCFYPNMAAMPKVLSFPTKLDENCFVRDYAAKEPIVLLPSVIRVKGKQLTPLVDEMNSQFQILLENGAIQKFIYRSQWTIYMNDNSSVFIKIYKSSSCAEEFILEFQSFERYGASTMIKSIVSDRILHGVIYTSNTIKNPFSLENNNEAMDCDDDDSIHWDDDEDDDEDEESEYSGDINSLGLVSQKMQWCDGVDWEKEAIGLFEQKVVPVEASASIFTTINIEWGNFWGLMNKEIDESEALEPEIGEPEELETNYLSEADQLAEIQRAGPLSLADLSNDMNTQLVFMNTQHTFAALMNDYDESKLSEELETNDFFEADQLLAEIQRVGPLSLSDLDPDRHEYTSGVYKYNEDLFSTLMNEYDGSKCSGETKLN